MNPNSEPEYLLDMDYLKDPIVSYYRDLVNQPFGCAYGGVTFYNGLALAVIDSETVEVYQILDDAGNSPTVPFLNSEDGGITYVANDEKESQVKKVETNIEGKVYLKSYIEGFKAGRKYFEDFYQPSASIVYGSELKSYTENLHKLYKHQDMGWLWRAKYRSCSVTHDTFREYGYYAGLCYSIDLLVKMYPQLEKDIKVCLKSHTNPSNQQPNSYHSVSTLSDSEKTNYAVSILSPLGGSNPQKSLIMSREDFERLITYAKYLVLTDSIPAILTPISSTGISNEHIRFTFYKLHKALFGKSRIHASFIEFLHAVFKQFSGTSLTTTKAKFSIPPSSYDSDFTG